MLSVGTMPISVDRERRTNAGARMARLLNEEEEDEFYSNIYGGFTEEAEDVDYQSESSVEDVIDSDFADESSGSGDDDNVRSDDDEDKRQKRQSNRVVTKGYKEPKRTKVTRTQEAKSDKKASDKSSTDSHNKSTVPAKDKQQTTGSKKTSGHIPAYERPTLRASTLQATADQEAETTRRRVLTNENTAIRRKALLAEIAQRKNLPEVRRLTQEELLAEAKITEEINRRSLARYQRLEIEKKKARIQKTVNSTPMIRYHSFTVPIIEEQHNIYGVSASNDEPIIRAGPIITNPSAKCSRNLITFANDVCFRDSMPETITPLPEPGCPAPTPIRPERRLRICPITGQPARYLDPLTLTPYANLAAFRVLRRLYSIHLETRKPPMELLREYRQGRQ
ncbi:Vacuolar protein sorting-associated protein 72 [Schistosoma japonicum]|uniref:Vacuolar protein sorting-associated protein 72 homolog n=1 Tax=Schistosoma japonicum TaxID=6182 RepID=A0A4Z2D4H4_SCHJA|nr:Vacuolar protein sorting-associated protein 72 like [Schistosoma japonicum]TNN11364.1 Vacuolar protein sorting-associated protein 72 [Schistosoma japonicum]